MLRWHGDRRFPAEVEARVVAMSASTMERLLQPLRRQGGRRLRSTRAAWDTMNRLYRLLRWYMNFFQPVRKLAEKTREGPKVRKHYDTAQTPYQRVPKANVLSPALQAQLAASYRAWNPVWLLHQINTTLEQLWRLAERPPRSRKVSSTRGTVAVCSDASMPFSVTASIDAPRRVLPADGPCGPAVRDTGKGTGVDVARPYPSARSWTAGCWARSLWSGRWPLQAHRLVEGACGWLYAGLSGLMPLYDVRDGRLRHSPEPLPRLRPPA